MTRVRPTSLILIIASVGGTVAISVGVDAMLLGLPGLALKEIVLYVALFNVGSILVSIVGAVIEWRRPEHTIGRLLLLGGPIYATLSAGWTVGDHLPPLVNWAGSILSWPGVALLVGWIPLLFPSGGLPSPRWRYPVAVLVVLSGIGLVAMAVRPGPMVEDLPFVNPMGIDGWPSVLQPFVDAIGLEMIALIGLALAALVTRYRRGDATERLQIRWFAAAVSVCLAGFAGAVVEQGLRGGDSGPLLSAVIANLGIVFMPVAVGIAILRYRLYAIDRIISRTVAWAMITVALVAVYASGIVALQAALDGLTQGDSVAVAASTLAAAALFQPLRRHIQAAVDRRFDRARVDAERTLETFSARLRDEMDLASITGALRGAVHEAVTPAAVSVSLRRRDSGLTKGSA